MSKGCNIQEFSVGDTSVGDGLTLHPIVEQRRKVDRKGKGGRLIKRGGRWVAKKKTSG
jgi:hypothetical protein